MRQYSLYILIILSSYGCCNRDGICPSSRYSDWLPENINYITFISNNDIEATIFLIPVIKQSENYGCNTCGGELNVSGDFLFQGNEYQLDIDFETRGEYNQEFIETETINFTFDELNFTYDFESEEFDNIEEINLGSYSLYDNQVIDETYQLNTDDGEITEVLYSLEEGLIQFTTLDNTIWKRQF